jgi:hypothetical protein
MTATTKSGSGSGGVARYPLASALVSQLDIMISTETSE